MSTIDKRKFPVQNVTILPSETIDAPCLFILGSVFRQFLKKINRVIMLGFLVCHYLDELYLPNVLRFDFNMM